jgi:dethiobiotin synthetase
MRIYGTMKNKYNAIFVTGTDTGVGKTYISSLLLGFLRHQGLDAGYQKWLSSGGSDCADLNFCLEQNDITPDTDSADLQAVYCFKYPAAPHLAAKLEGREVDPERIISSFRQYERQKQIVVVEGVGGLLVPVRRDLLLADFLIRLELPTLIVARTGLGTINHTLLTIEALRSRSLPILGIIFSDDENDDQYDEMLLADNMQTITEFSQVPVFGRIRRQATYTEAEELFLATGELFFKRLKKFIPDFPAP